ncbi:helix-turn-helix domain-containing protein [Actinocorallia glomerata]
MVSERISIRKAAAACGVSLSTVDRWVSQSQAGKPHGANGGGVSDGMCEPYREER